MNSLPTIPLFPAGQIVATPGALALLEEAKTPLEFLSSHLRGDSGDVCQDDKAENKLSLKYGFRLMSSYQITHAEKLWTITEADRSVTTMLLPTEYERPARNDGSGACSWQDHTRLFPTPENRTLPAPRMDLHLSG